MLAHFIIGFALFALFGLFATELSSQVFCQVVPNAYTFQTS